MTKSLLHTLHSKRILQMPELLGVDEEVVVDGQLITSRNPGDIPAFSQQIIEGMSKYKAAFFILPSIFEDNVIS